MAYVMNPLVHHFWEIKLYEFLEMAVPFMVLIYK